MKCVDFQNISSEPGRIFAHCRTLPARCNHSFINYTISQSKKTNLLASVLSWGWAMEESSKQLSSGLTGTGWALDLWSEELIAGSLKGVWGQVFVLLNVNRLLLGGQQAVHGCRHCLHVDLRQSQTEQSIQFVQVFIINTFKTSTTSTCHYYSCKSYRTLYV